MKIASVVHNFLEPLNLDPVLSALTSQTAANLTHQIIVFENGLPQSQKETYQSRFPHVAFLHTEKFIGFSQGLNAAIKQALQDQADFVWLTDPFIIPLPDMFNQFLIAATSYKEYLGFTPKIYTDQTLKTISSAGFTTDWTNLTFSPRAKNEPDQPLFDRDLEVDYIPTNQLFIKSKTWSEIGLFDTRLFVYCFDLDLYSKIRYKGFRLNFISQAHAIGLPGHIALPSSAEVYYGLRDRIYYSFLNSPGASKLISFKTAFDKYFHGSPWEKRAIRDIMSAKLAEGSYQWE